RTRASAPAATSWAGTSWTRSITCAFGAIDAMTPLHTPTNSSAYPKSDRKATNRRVAASPIQVLLAGLGGTGGQVPVDVALAHPERAADAEGRQVSRLDQPVDGNGRDTHQVSNFLNSQETRLGERLDHGIPLPLPPRLPERTPKGKVLSNEADVG